MYYEELLARLRGSKAVMADEENSPSSDPAALLATPRRPVRGATLAN